MLRIEDVETVMIEGGQCPDDPTHHRHRMGIAAEPAIDRVQLLVHHRVVGDVAGELVELAAVGNSPLSSSQQISR